MISIVAIIIIIIIAIIIAIMIIITNITSFAIIIDIIMLIVIIIIIIILIVVVIVIVIISRRSTSVRSCRQSARPEPALLRIPRTMLGVPFRSQNSTVSRQGVARGTAPEFQTLSVRIGGVQ